MSNLFLLLVIGILLFRLCLWESLKKEYQRYFSPVLVKKRHLQYLRRNCPRFDEDFPPSDNLKYYKVYAGLDYECLKGAVHYEEGPIHGLGNAYIKARELALILEKNTKWKNPRMSAYADGSYPNSIGVFWSIEELKENSIKVS